MSARRPPGLPALVLNNNNSGNSGNSGNIGNSGGANGAVTGPLPASTLKVAASSITPALSLTSDNKIMTPASASKGAVMEVATPTPTTARRWTAARAKLHSDANTDRYVKEGRPANRS